VQCYGEGVPDRGGYSFGDTAVAQERLDLLAAVFEPPSRAFLRDAVTSPPSLACDLGCGPGNTTRMLRDVTGARRVVGLDSSAAFIRSARAQSAREPAAREPAAGEPAEFLEWDAADPLPVGQPDLVYARMLLAHLPTPGKLAAAWAGQLAPGGLLLLDEVERIDTAGTGSSTGTEVFTDYLTVVVARIRSAGAEMYAGPLLGTIPLNDDCEVITDQVATHPVPASRAARLFRLNLSVWGDDPWVAARFGPDTAERLDRELAQVRDEDGEISWRMRQVAIRRAG
jgi:trans-aconitate 2-methyltransferase